MANLLPNYTSTIVRLCAGFKIHEDDAPMKCKMAIRSEFVMADDPTLLAFGVIAGARPARLGRSGAFICILLL